MGPPGRLKVVMRYYVNRLPEVRMDLSRPESGESETYEKRFQYYVAMLESPDPGNRWKAAESLARTGDNRAVDPLISALSDEDWRVRQKAAWALGYLGDPKAIPALRRAYRDDLEGVREMITEAITMITMRVSE
jgi:HEAT repeat protein